MKDELKILYKVATTKRNLTEEKEIAIQILTAFALFNDDGGEVSVSVNDKFSLACTGIKCVEMSISRSEDNRHTTTVISTTCHPNDVDKIKAKWWQMIEEVVNILLDYCEVNKNSSEYRFKLK